MHTLAEDKLSEIEDEQTSKVGILINKFEPISATHYQGSLSGCFSLHDGWGNHRSSQDISIRGQACSRINDVMLEQSILNPAPAIPT